MDRLFFILYTTVVTIAYAISLPYTLLLSKKRPKYRESLPARFFLKGNRPLKGGGVWFHICSFGEAKGIEPIIKRLPKELLRATAITDTGYGEVSSKIEESRYLPFEPLLFSWVKPQKVLVVMEAEFWYLLFALAKRRGAKTMLINGRISDRSFPKYRRVSWLYKMIFRYIDEVYAQTELDRERLEELGAKNITVIGNIKLADTQPATKSLTKPKSLLVSGASTHKGEEELILDAFKELKKRERDAKLILAPRHPERFREVSLMVEEFSKLNGYSWHNYSDSELLNSDIVVLDTLGELINIYAVSDIVILGGAFEPIGGHNGAEASQFGCKIISGKHYFNQRDIFSMIDGIATVEREDLAKTLIDHRELKNTKIIGRTDIEPILKSIERVIDGKSV